MHIATAVMVLAVSFAIIALVQERFDKMKTLEWWKSRGINVSPQVSFVMNTHNMSDKVMGLLPKLREYPGAEIIIVDDGSDFKHTETLARELTGVNEFLLHCNDLFEVLTTNRAFYFARGKYIAMLQDDDDILNLDWVTEAVKLFEAWPRLAVLGGRDIVNLGWDGSEFKYSAYQVNSFQFVQTVDAAPLWIRRSAFLELGGFDTDFAPCMWSEHELCLRAWLSGWQVGWYPAGLKVCGFENESRRGNKLHLTWGANNANLVTLERNFKDKMDDINKKVADAQ